jgi:anti-sigma regulatory factor (Ser/Thr protein kinase)
LRPTDASVAEARRFVRSNVPLDVEVGVVVVAASGLVANVVEHASTDVNLTVEIEDDVVRVLVRDGAAATEAFRELISAPPSPVPSSSPRGRGLSIVKRLTSTVGLTDVDDGKAVWFEVIRRGD